MTKDGVYVAELLRCDGCGARWEHDWVKEGWDSPTAGGKPCGCDSHVRVVVEALEERSANRSQMDERAFRR